MATSSSVTSVGGMLIVTQVIPQDVGDTKSMPLRPADAAPPTDEQATPPALPTKKDAGFADYQRGEIPGLGVVQLVIGSLCVLFSLTAISRFLLAHVAFCLCVWFLVSGWLSLAAHRKPSIRLIWACLWSNVISVLLSLAGFAYLSWLLATSWSSRHVCGEQLFDDPSAWGHCVGNLRLLNRVLQGLRGLIMALLFMEAGVCLMICVRVTKEIRTRFHYAPIMVGNGGSCSGGNEEA
ncbi:uncharacterized protein LOC127600842 [Hippocampus zosterae]|uniref:uncharacterized protein LOC127600842 n=1 Tax=Hippocampus zosterae TaxID=109293 RepID=UPI00223CD076|nr:uncharacterized protein LOC127600842 [Hippocampus zosterae]XP_051921643.1 uncharacterized protein LOC127600842 [Hippocampus zosterae]